MDSVVAMKVCRVCGAEKPIDIGFHSKRADCKTCRSRSEKKVKVDPFHAELMTDLPESDRYIVTYAQNATPVHPHFLASLKVYADSRGAQLVVLPGRYKNPTSIWSEQMEHDEWWDSSVQPYLFEGRADLGHITIYGDISIQPTAVRPLTGFEVFAGTNSAVFGHPKIQLHTVATAKRRYPRIFTTTGAVTQPNYTHSKAGKKGEAHHVFGATVIELDGDLFHLRQINAVDETGCFIDLDREFTPDGVRKAKRALALVPGDIHVDKSDVNVLNATFFDQDSMVSVLEPEKIVYHDLLDFDTRNHHRMYDFTDRYARAVGKKNDIVEDEVSAAVAFIDETTPQKSEPIVVLSNHDEAFDRWLRTADPKADPVNAKFFHQMWFDILSEYERSGSFVPAFELYYRDNSHYNRASFIQRDEILRIADIYCNFHGDKGLNGAKGSTLSYAKLGVKTITGHSHSPAIVDGAYVVGVTGSLDQGYNFTPSSWAHAHAVIYANGRRSLLFVVDGRWRA